MGLFSFFLVVFFSEDRSDYQSDMHLYYHTISLGSFSPFFYRRFFQAGAEWPRSGFQWSASFLQNNVIYIARTKVFCEVAIMKSSATFLLSLSLSVSLHGIGIKEFILPDSLFIPLQCSLVSLGSSWHPYPCKTMNGCQKFPIGFRQSETRVRLE